MHKGRFEDERKSRIEGAKDLNMSRLHQYSSTYSRRIAVNLNIMLVHTYDSIQMVHRAVSQKQSQAAGMKGGNSSE